MTVPPLYLLDTNILVHFVRSDTLWARIRARHQPLALGPKPSISIVTAGELRSLALQYRWGKAKIDQMEFILGYFDEIPIDSPALVDAYAVIDSHLQLQGHILGKNDLWIAATAHILGATLLTTDRDFDSEPVKKSVSNQSRRLRMESETACHVVGDGEPRRSGFDLFETSNQELP